MIHLAIMIVDILVMNEKEVASFHVQKKETHGTERLKLPSCCVFCNREMIELIPPFRVFLGFGLDPLVIVSLGE